MMAAVEREKARAETRIQVAAGPGIVQFVAGPGIVDHEVSIVHKSGKFWALFAVIGLVIIATSSVFIVKAVDTDAAEAEAGTQTASPILSPTHSPTASPIPSPTHSPTAAPIPAVTLGDGSTVTQATQFGQIDDQVRKFTWFADVQVGRNFQGLADFCYYWGEPDKTSGRVYRMGFCLPGDPSGKFVNFEIPGNSISFGSAFPAGLPDSFQLEVRVDLTSTNSLGSPQALFNYYLDDTFLGVSAYRTLPEAYLTLLKKCVQEQGINQFHDVSSFYMVLGSAPDMRQV